MGRERLFKAEERGCDGNGSIWFEKKAKKCIDELVDRLQGNYIGAAWTVEKEMRGWARTEVSQLNPEREDPEGL